MRAQISFDYISAVTVYLSRSLISAENAGLSIFTFTGCPVS